MRVLKFGGTSVGSAERIKQLKAIVDHHEAKEIVIVVSAFSGVTNMLTEMSAKAAAGDLSYTKILQDIKQRHFDTARELVDETIYSKVSNNIQLMLYELENFLHGIYLIKELSAKTQDYVLSFGERLSAFTVSKALHNATYLDISPYMRTNSNFGNARVLLDEATPLVQACFAKITQMPVVPGFIGSNANNVMTTLGRGGSDYTAAILANILDAEMLEIWTDVDGFMTADPRKVSKTYSIASLSYAEAMELSHFGAKVLYTPTVQPVYSKSIPVLVKNTINPQSHGTLISNNEDKDSGKAIKGIASIEEISLITLAGSGMVGVAGSSMRLFKVLAENKINVIIISQASSESSISFAVQPADAEVARQALAEEFAHEMRYYNSIRVEVEENLSVIAIVGENMKKTPGISAKLFDALGRNGINVIAIAQGSSELNISVVIERKSLRKALNVVHEGFFLSGVVSLNVFQIGVGTVGGDLLQQIQAQQEQLRKNHHLDIRLVGLSNSRKMIFDPEGIDLANYKTLLEQSPEAADMDAFVGRINAMNLRNSVLADCTANAKVSTLYKDALNSYISVVTANKIACSSEIEKYEELKQISLKRGVKFLYETNVGAGLPILRTISDLKKSGDTILKIEAVLSGTLTFIFNTISQNVPMSETIRQALEKGYAEPDPRIDLSGIDVLRKLLILTREAGYRMEQSDIKVEKFLSEKCFASSLDDFWTLVKDEDAGFEKRRKVLETNGKRWRYVASFDTQNAEIKLIEVSKDHPFYDLKGSDNIVLLTTERYLEQPMMIKGPGAGAAVTATGVFADLIRVVNM